MKPTEPKRARDEALDWVKGALVVLMVVYHSLNYSPYTPVAFDYIAFLPPSFIFVAGFLLTNSYLARYDLKDWRLHQRLVMRGAKLILLFTALNLGLYFIALGPAAVGQFAENVQAIYLAADGRVASFSILTSIGYLLLLAPLLLRNRFVESLGVAGSGVGPLDVLLGHGMEGLRKLSPGYDQRRDHGNGLRTLAAGTSHRLCQEMVYRGAALLSVPYR